MTEDNRRAEIAQEILRAGEARRAADALLGLGLHSDAVSRAYYAVFHWLRAVLLSRGVEPKTHAGAIHLFNLELVRNGLFSSSHNRLIGGLQRSRELADYDSAVSFSAADATAELTQARLFRDAALTYLTTQGWLGPRS